MKKDKEKVLDEVWTDERVEGFLSITSHDEVAEDFHMLLKSYQSMRADDFRKFINLFCAEGRDLNTPNPAGRTVLSIASEHRNSGEFVDILRAAGAA
jgi:hypothetical protein